MLLSRTSIGKSFSLLTILTIIEKIVAFIFQGIIAGLFGASIMTDAYYSASELFGVLEVTVISSLTVIALNRFSYYESHGGDKVAFPFLSSLLSFYEPVIITLSVGIFVFAEQISFLVAPGFSTDARVCLVICIRTMTIVPIVECITAIGLAVLRQKRRFGITSLKSLFISVVGIVAIIFFHKTPINHAFVLSAAYAVSMFLFCVLTILYVSQYGKLRLAKPRITPEIRETIRMILPLIVSYGITRTSLMIGKIIASLLGDGSVSILTYAHNLFAVVNAIFVTNISMILLTDFNELMAADAYQEVSAKIRTVISVMTILLIPITIISIVCSNDVVKIVYERGRFTAEFTGLVAGVLAVYALNFIPSMIHGIYNQVLYAKGDTKTPMWIAAISITVNISVSNLLIARLGLSSVAIGTLVSSVVAVVLCGKKVKKIMPEYRGCYTTRSIVSYVVAGCVCVVGALWVKSIVLPAILSFALATVMCFGVFVLCLVLMKEENTTVVLKMISEKLNIKLR